MEAVYFRKNAWGHDIWKFIKVTFLTFVWVENHKALVLLFDKLIVYVMFIVIDVSSVFSVFE